jgi:hypothetical protein
VGTSTTPRPQTIVALLQTLAPDTIPPGAQVTVDETIRTALDALPPPLDID